MSDDTKALCERLSALADYFSPPSGAGTDHAISCECAKCKWADDLRQGAHTIESQAARIAALERELAQAPENAERYRWLREASVKRGDIPYDNWWAELGDELGADFDEHIDAAMKGASDE